MPSLIWRKVIRAKPSPLCRCSCSVAQWLLLGLGGNLGTHSCANGTKTHASGCDPSAPMTWDLVWMLIGMNEVSGGSSTVYWLFRSISLNVSRNLCLLDIRSIHCISFHESEIVDLSVIVQAPTELVFLHYCSWSAISPTLFSRYFSRCVIDYSSTACQRNFNHGRYSGLYIRGFIPLQSHWL